MEQRAQPDALALAAVQRGLSLVADFRELLGSRHVSAPPVAASDAAVSVCVERHPRALGAVATAATDALHSAWAALAPPQAAAADVEAERQRLYVAASVSSWCRAAPHFVKGARAGRRAAFASLHARARRPSSALPG